MNARGTYKPHIADEAITRLEAASAVPAFTTSRCCLPSFRHASHMSQGWCSYACTSLEGCRQMRMFTKSQRAPHLDERSSVLKESERGGSWGMSVCTEEARKSKHLERHTQGYAPGDGALASLTERAKKTPTFKRHLRHRGSEAPG